MANDDLVTRVLAAARATIGDPALRAKLVPDAVDDVDPEHLERRIEAFEEMQRSQRTLLSTYRTLAENNPAPTSPQRAARVAEARRAAERFTPDAAAIDALFAVAHQLSDERLATLTRDLEQLVKGQAMDLEILFRMDAAAERRRSVPDVAERKARLEQMLERTRALAAKR